MLVLILFQEKLSLEDCRKIIADIETCPSMKDEFLMGLSGLYPDSLTYLIAIDELSAGAWMQWENKPWGKAMGNRLSMGEKSREGK